MVDMAAITGAASALKTAYDLGKAALGAHDAAVVKAKISEMQGEIHSALSSAISAQTEQVALLKRVDKLEKQLADRKAFDRDMKRYELVELPPGIYIRQLKASAAAPGEPIHSICPTCHGNGKKFPLHKSEPNHGVYHLTCHSCGTKLSVGHFSAPSRANTRRGSAWTFTKERLITIIQEIRRCNRKLLNLDDEIQASRDKLLQQHPPD